MCRRGLPTGVDSVLVSIPYSFVSMLRREMILLIGKGWDILNIFLSSWVTSIPRNLFISPSTVNMKFSLLVSFTWQINQCLSWMAPQCWSCKHTFKLSFIFLCISTDQYMMAWILNQRVVSLVSCNNCSLLGLIRISFNSVSVCNAFCNLLQFGRQLGIWLEVAFRYFIPDLPVVRLIQNQ